MKMLVMADLRLDTGPLDLIKAGRHPGAGAGSLRLGMTRISLKPA